MPTNKVGTKTVEEFMNDYTPIYSPIFGLFLGKSRSYSEQVGVVDFKRIEAVGDVRAKVWLPKDTEIEQIQARDGKKSFKKYFLGKQFVISALQDQEGIDSLNSQVLDEHNKQFDELMLLGGGTAANNVLNNGLYWSSDSNYVLETSVELDNASGYLPAFQTALSSDIERANRLSGRKLVIIYGSALMPYWNSVYTSYPTPFKTVAAQLAGPEYTFMQLPADITPAGANGWMIVNVDQIMFHYTVLPGLWKQGTNEEKEYNWFNYLMGSNMIEVLAPGAVIRQPVTLEAL